MKKRTADQAQSQATVISKLSRVLPPTPPSSQRVTPKQQYGTKEHYARRARRLSSLAAGLRRPTPVSIETKDTLKRLKGRAGLNTEAKNIPLPPTKVDYPFGNPQMKYIMTSPENVMSGATRAYRKGARKIRTTGKGTEGEDKILTVPRNFKSIMRRGRRARKEGRMRRFGSDVAGRDVRQK